MLSCQGQPGRRRGHSPATGKVTAAALAAESGFGGRFAEDIDDWCGTGWPRRWPKRWPAIDPDPSPWDVAQVQLGGLLAAAEISAHYDDAHVVAAFDKAIEMLGDAAVNQFGG